MPDMFLTKEETVTLTGRKFKRLQIEQLRKMGIWFWVNAIGATVVPWIAIEEHPSVGAKPKPASVPNVLQGKWHSQKRPYMNT